MLSFMSSVNPLLSDLWAQWENNVIHFCRFGLILTPPLNWSWTYTDMAVGEMLVLWLTVLREWKRRLTSQRQRIQINDWWPKSQLSQSYLRPYGIWNKTDTNWTQSTPADSVLMGCEVWVGRFRWEVWSGLWDSLVADWVCCHSDSEHTAD